MKIRTIEAFPLNVSLQSTLRFGNVDRKQSFNVVVRVTTDDGLVGYGEACPIPAFTRETQESITESLEGELQEHLVGADPMSRDPLLTRLEGLLTDRPFTLAAIDMALWDLAGKALGVPAWELLGGKFRNHVDAHGSIGIAEPAAMAELSKQQVAMGFKSLKLYAGRNTLEADLQCIGAVRDAVGEGIPFILDINGQWDADTCLRALPALEELNVILIEQPLPAGAETEQARVVGANSIGVVADEAVFVPQDVARLGSGRAASVINLGLSKLGGIRRAKECAVTARAAGLEPLVGGVVELGIATAAGLHLAANLPDLSYPTYLIGPIKYEQDVAMPQLTLDQGRVRIPDGPGLGIDVDVELLQHLDVRR